MTQLTQSVTAFVFVGGKSIRMGQDKALLRLPSGETLAEHILEVAASVAPEVCILGSRSKYAALAWEGEIVEDIHRDCGPLGGIHAALSRTRTELNLMLAVDMPRVTQALLEFLVTRASMSKKLVIVPRIGGREQPLCAVYRRELLGRVERAIEDRKLKVASVFTPELVEYIEEEEFKEHQFASELFDNLNAPEDWLSFVAGKK